MPLSLGSPWLPVPLGSPGGGLHFCILFFAVGEGALSFGVLIPCKYCSLWTSGASLHQNLSLCGLRDGKLPEKKKSIAPPGELVSM